MTVSTSSLTSGGLVEESFDTASVEAPAGSLLALWLTDNDGLTPSVSGLGLTWTVTDSVSYTFGHLVLVTASVGDSEVSGAISVSYSSNAAVAYDLDCVSGDDGETLAFGVSALGAQVNSGGAGNASLTFAGGPAFYLFGSAAAYSGNFSASPAESPTAWTRLAFVQAYIGGGDFVAVALETEVSPDASNPNALTDWSGTDWEADGGGQGAIGIPVSVS
jgi:hypothetical protein